MTDFTKELTETLMEGKNLDEVFRHHLEKALNELLRTELSVFLDYEKYDRKGVNSGNSRNGKYERTIKSRFGELNVSIPRDRNGEFQNRTLPPYRRHDDTLETTVIHLYQKGVTTAEIADLIEKMYGHNYSKQTVSNLTRIMQEHVEAFRKRSLKKRYSVIYLDATRLPLRRDTVEQEAVYMAVGITLAGHKELIGYAIHPEESAFNWKHLLQDFKKRGLEEALLFVTDGLKEIRTSIGEVFPKARHQTCWVHIARNISHKVRVKDRSTVLSQLKTVYHADSAQAAKERLSSFRESWKSTYPRMVRTLDDTASLFTFFEFPEAIRRSLYTTNLIENFHRQLKRKTKSKVQFPNLGSLERFLVQHATEYNQKHSDKAHKGFKQVRAELEELFQKHYGE